jgi:S-adenosylmethionine:tRNA-ribosyltransferase-isomerase (queuine synthetase)
MPYTKKKGGRGYIVYKKSGKRLVRVGTTTVGKIKKYMAALHANDKKR